MHTNLSLKTTRQSNFELLRIVAMFLVLVVHSDFRSLGSPTTEDIANSPLSACTRIFIQSLSVVCVDVFVLISGWFGIKPSWKGFGNFIFQCLYFGFGIYLFLLVTGRESFSFNSFMQYDPIKLHWFVLAYIGLYILSPILNAYVTTCSKQQLLYTLIAFYTFQTLYGWNSAASWVREGYSTFSFIGLYLLARYLNLYGSKETNALKYFVLYLGIAALNSIYATMYIYHPSARSAYAYVNPLVIIASCLLLMAFARMKIPTNKVINFVGKSAFSVYLFHTTPFTWNYFQTHIQQIFHTTNNVACLATILGFILIVYAFSIALDWPRRMLWDYAVSRFSAWKMRKTT